ncbi:MAG: phosphoribosylanthranilate isomerase [Candidatus Dormibacteraeota bacterium]|nr:phosphoribosylanthranilate isomerase [Candidatus Dormibacteraeota bacterium]
MTKIKICGNTRPEDVELALELGVGLLGFIFTRSKRRLTIPAGRALTAGIPPAVERVGVFLDEPPEEIARVVEACSLSAIQVYRPLLAEDRALGVGLLPAVRVKDGDELRQLRFEPGDHPLLDTWAPDVVGGTGRRWNWPEAFPLARRYPLAVSGGLNADNVGQAIEDVKPWAVDVCSGVEREPGTKDPVKLRAFVEAVGEADRR